MSFYDEISKIDVDKFISLVDSRTDADVEHAIAKEGRHTIEDFAALISENARKHYLDVMVQKSKQTLTKKLLLR